MIDLVLNFTQGDVEKGGVETLVKINQLNHNVV